MICWFYVRLIAGVSLWLLAIVLILSLAGCLSISSDTGRKLGGFVVDADCEKDTVHVELQIDEEHMDQDAGVER